VSASNRFAVGAVPATVRAETMKSSVIPALTIAPASPEPASANSWKSSPFAVSQLARRV